MNKLEILKEKIFDLPLDSKDTEYLKFIIQTNAEIIKLVESVNDLKLLEKVRYITKSIEMTIQYVYEGKYNKGYDELSIVLNEFESELKKLNVEMKKSYSDIYYRVRCVDGEVNEKGEKWSLQDNFHLPFGLRHLCKNQRYSISGYPCLYLARTVYTCWEEFGRPELDKMIVSKYKIPSTYNILYLSYLPYQLKYNYYKEQRIRKISMNELLDEKNEYLNTYIALLPLILASSVKRQHVSASFHAEYIIPQILTQWVRSESDFDGIMYFSTMTYTRSSKNSALYENLVIPTKKVESKEFCDELSSGIKMTDPIMKSDIDKEILFTHQELEESNYYCLGHIISDLKDGSEIKYSSSELHEFEKSLSLIPLKQMN